MTHTHFVYCYENGKNSVLTYHYSEGACIQFLDIIFRTHLPKGARIWGKSVLIEHDGKVLKKWAIGLAGEESSLGLPMPG